MSMSIYRLTNTCGISGRSWARTYDTLDEAVSHLACAMGWDEVFLGEPVNETNRTVIAAYPSEKSADDESSWANAPKIVESPA